MTIKDYGKYLEDSSEKIPIAGCWIWTKATHKFGHGIATRNDTKKSGLAHRESYKYYVGDIPNTTQINHSCDNPSCINPSHLYLGTQKDNMLDVSSRGRWPNRSGSANITSKLSDVDVEYIKSYPTYRGSGVVLGKLFGVSRTTICDIRKGKTWK